MHPQYFSIAWQMSPVHIWHSHRCLHVLSTTTEAKKSVWDKVVQSPVKATATWHLISTRYWHTEKLHGASWNSRV